MKEPFQYYNQTTKLDLKDTYPFFYSQFLQYLDSLPEKWFFVDCFNIHLDGSVFSITLHNGRNHHLYVKATKGPGCYCFEEIKRV